MRGVNLEKSIEVKNLSKFYKNKKAVDNISFSINKGEIVGLIGPNGSGKTTTLKAITGLIRPTQGDIYINNKNIKDNINKSLMEIGALIETPDFYPYLSGYENLMQVFRLHNNPPSILNEMIQIVGLTDRIHDNVKKYSLGMKQRLAICRALISIPSILILDEPLNGLDIEGVIDFRKIIKDFSSDKNHSIIISSHDLHELEKICTRFIFIKDGHIVKDCDANDLSGEDTYLIITDNPRIALQLLVDNKIDASEYNDKIKVKTFENQISDVNSLLVCNGIKVSGIEKVMQTLENEYLKIVGKGSNKSD